LEFVEFDPFHKEEHPCSTVFLSAVKFVRKMNGGSQSILVQCDDHKYYVVKMTGNPRGENALANEVLGSMIVGAVGLPVAEGRAIYISDRFIDGEPDLWFELPSGTRRPYAGLHFGSLLVGQTSGPARPSEYISRSRVETITNRSAFLGMYILDVWANHQDSRQAIFLKTSNDKQEVFFIDHGQMFGGSGWSFQECPGTAYHLEGSVYAKLWHEKTVSSWISHFRTILPEILGFSASIIPSQWYNGDLCRLVEELSHRVCNISELVQKDVTNTQHFTPQEIENDTLRLSDSRIHVFRTPNTRSTIYRDLAASYAKFIHPDGLCFAKLEGQDRSISKRRIL
jgi:hypothetical protein